MPDELVTIKETAERLGCHTMTVRRLMESGKLGPVIRMGRKFVRLKKIYVDAYVIDHTEAAK